MSSSLWNIKLGPDSLEMKELAARICRDYLNGPWKQVSAQNIGFNHISGGLSNLLYHISLPETPQQRQHPKKKSQDPTSVLIRVYGPTHGDRGIEHMITESVIFTLLSERGLGPKLYGLFPGGRIEQYINARPLQTRELSDPKLTHLIAKKMASIHSMEVPLQKEPGWLWETIDKWLKRTELILSSDKVPDLAKILTQIDYKEEVGWLKKRIDMENCPVVFCHNDMQEGNILIKQDVNDNEGDVKLVLIDFEYCSYNYRSYDLANHFIEYTYDYTEESPPLYKENFENYPSVQQRLAFINSYLEETRKNEDPQKILKEVHTFTMATHFFWCLWSIVNTEMPVIPFGYWEYAVSRMNGYLRTKEELKPSSVAVKRKSSELDL
nr:choline/ethanolamine kinase isoform X2 [Onthophagus taurus]